MKHPKHNRLRGRGRTPLQARAIALAKNHPQPVARRTTAPDGEEVLILPDASEPIVWLDEGVGDSFAEKLDVFLDVEVGNSREREWLLEGF